MPEMPEAEMKRRPGRPRVYSETRRDLHIALPEELLNALDEAAGTEGRSVYIERVLRDVLKRRPNAPVAGDPSHAG